MPTASTNNPTSTNSPTRNSVQVSCLRRAMDDLLPAAQPPPFSSELRASQIDYSKVTPESAPDKHRSMRRSLPAGLQSRRDPRDTQGIASPGQAQLPQPASWSLQHERRASSAGQSGNSP